MEVERFIEAYRDKPFVWGARDCGTFAADWVRAQTRRDIWLPYAGYSTAMGAALALRRRGHADIGDALSEALDEKPVAKAAPGDVVTVDTRDGHAAGILSFAVVYVMSPGGVAMFDPARVTRAFSIYRD
ncbi:MAG: hypothetical protein Tsb0010_10610 [Parvularculaceae bacterium]